jgi:hypothetical protein
MKSACFPSLPIPTVWLPLADPKTFTGSFFVDYFVLVYIFLIMVEPTL